LGNALAPAFERFAAFFIEEVVPPLTKFFEEDFPVMLAKFGEAGAGIAESFGPIGVALKEALEIPESTTLLEGLLDKIANLPDNPAFMQIVDSIVELTPGLLELLPPMTELVENLLPLLVILVPALTWLVTLFADIVGGLAQGFADVTEQMGTFFDDGTEGLSIVEKISQAFANFDAAVLRVRDALWKAVDALREFLRLNAESNRVPGVPMLNVPRGTRAVGGPVSAMDSYLVGERGPELFTPGAGGFITPNNRLGGGSGNTYNITVNAGMGSNGTQLGAEIVSLIKRYERSSGPVFASV
jgi:hypothetical protein